VSTAVALRVRFLDRFCHTARARIGRSLELLATGASTHAAAIHIELYSLAGESAFLGCSEIFSLARQGEAAARQISDDPAAIVACMRAVRSLSRALEALDVQRPGRKLHDVPLAGPSDLQRPGGRGRVLLVDDSKLSADLLTIMITEAGFAVETASNAAGLERALAGFRPQLVLSDVTMPGLDCAYVCRRAKEVLPAARVVLISGLEEIALLHECRRVNADGYVSRERGLAAALERVLSELPEQGS
jgi:CheY-like chemotaxis protein